MKQFRLWSSLITAGVLLTACGDSTTNNTYRVTLKNLTYSQPMSPMIVSYHNKNVTLFSVGEAVDVPFENLAEGGSNAQLITQHQSNANVSSVVGGSSVIPPSKSDSVVISGTVTECISMASMLVNTNDAFVGSSCINISGLKIGEKVTINLPAYDAGTEANSETLNSIPGPVAGGEGFNVLRDDTNFVHIHPNVISQDDGLTTSVLTQAHRWDNPTARLTIERI